MLVIASLESGGAERAMAQLADALVARGIAVDLVTWADGEAGDFHGLDPRVRRHARNWPAAKIGPLTRAARGLSVLAWMRRLMRETAPDCVLSFIDQGNVLTLAASAGLGRRVVVAERVDPRANDTLGPFWRLARFLVYRRADLVVGQTEAVAAWMSRRWGARTTCIPNFLRPLPPPAATRENVVVSVGRLVPQKAFDLAIRAFARVAPDFPGWRYVILGEGPCRTAWMRLCETLGISDRVRFEGLSREVEHWLGRAAIAVQPSRFEGFPNAVMEAMGMGVATISSDCPSGPSDLIEHGVDGILVPVGEVDALAREMAVLMGDPGLRQTLGSRAMALRERLSGERIMARWMAALSGEERPAATK